MLRAEKQTIRAKKQMLRAKNRPIGAIWRSEAWMEGPHRGPIIKWSAVRTLPPLHRRPAQIPFLFLLPDRLTFVVVLFATGDGDFDCASFDRHDIADHPQFELFEFCFPALFEGFHPAAILGRVGKVDNDADEVVAVSDAGLAPVAFDALGFVAGGAKLLDDFEHRVSQPLCGDVAAVVELEGEQHLESPPLAAHNLPSR